MNALGAEYFDLPPTSVYDEEEIVSPKVNGTGRHVQSATSKALPFAFRRLEDFSIAPRELIVQGINWDAGSVCAVVGVPNGGKTAFAVDAGLHIAARAGRWLGLKITGGPVIYCAAEAPGSVHARAQGARSRKFPGESVPFYLIAAAPALGNSASGDTERLIETIKRVESEVGEAVKVLFIDTLASCLGDGDENGGGMLLLVNEAKHIAGQTGVCVVLIHHPSKTDVTGLRGHGSLAGACDSVLMISIEPATGVRIATLMKARDAATGMQLRFDLEQVMLDERDSFGDPCSTVIVKASATTAPRKRPTGKAQEKLLAELERRYRTGERTWDEATARKAGRDLSGMHRNSAKTALAGLVRDGYLVGSSSGYTLKYPPEGEA